MSKLKTKKNTKSIFVRFLESPRRLGNCPDYPLLYDPDFDTRMVQNRNLPRIKENLETNELVILNQQFFETFSCLKHLFNRVSQINVYTFESMFLAIKPCALFLKTDKACAEPILKYVTLSAQRKSQICK